MEQKSPDKVCYQFICPRYPKCARARGRGCCIEYPEDEAQMVRRGIAGPRMDFRCLWRSSRCVYIYDAFNENICLYIKNEYGNICQNYLI